MSAVDEPVWEASARRPGPGAEGPSAADGRAAPGSWTARLGRRRRWVFGAGLALTLATLAAAVTLAVRAHRESNPDDWFRRARAELAANHPERAAEAVERLARLRRPTPFDHLLRAQVAEALGRFEPALDELARIDQTHPLAPIARVLAGQIEMRRGRYRAAETALKAAVALEPRAVPPRRELSYLYSLQHRQADLDEQIYALSELGALELKYLIHWGKMRNLVWGPTHDCQVLARAIAADPDDRQSRLALAEGLRRLDRAADALKVLGPLPATDPEARALRAQIALERGDMTELDRLMAGAPRDDRALAAIRGRLDLRRGDFRAAARDFRIAHDADPTDRTVNFGLGTALRRLGDPKAAGPYLLAARRHDALTPLIVAASTAKGAEDPTLPARLGAACAAAGRPREARAWYRVAIARNPLDQESQEAFFRLGHQLDVEGRAETATAGDRR